MSGITQFLYVPGLGGLNADEEERIAYFLKSPGKDEFFFLLQMLGKTPAQVRNMMIEEFIRRFDLETYSDEIRNAFPSRRSWRAMDVALAEFASSMGVEEHLQFWDKMRYVFEAIPQRKDYGDKYSDVHEGNMKRPQKGWDFSTCRFCWRRVPYKSGVIRKTGSLCFKHDLPAMHSLYRRHRRLEQYFRGEQQPIVERLMALIEGCPSETEAQDLLYSHLTTTDSCLPRLADYLNRVGHEGTRESLLWAFHGPESEIKDPLHKEALENYIHYALSAKDTLDPSQPMPILSIQS